jgi:hypothetical protein
MLAIPYLQQGASARVGLPSTGIAVQTAEFEQIRAIVVMEIIDTAFAQRTRSMRVLLVCWRG